MENEDQRNSQASRSRVLTELNRVNSDFVMAMALQEQERLRLATIESESSNEEDDDREVASNDHHESFNMHMGAYDYFGSHDFDFDSFQSSELQLLDGGEFADEDEIDVDELRYEELVALGEFIGQEKRGLSLNEISMCMHACKYCSSVEIKSGIDRCVICQVEYEEEESMVALHPCEHPYHSECISKWLQVKKICPICSAEVSPPKNSLITCKLKLFNFY